MLMRRYYVYSGCAHAVALALLMLFIRPAAPRLPESSYTIDFIGGEKPVKVTSAEPAKAPEPAKPAPAKTAAKPAKAKPQDTEIKTPKQKNQTKTPPQAEQAPAQTQKEQEKLAALSAPSMLADEKAPPAEQAQPNSGDTGISAQFPDFPYPWYITQVRVSLWNEWSARMPRSGRISCVIRFAIARNGKIKDVKIEKSSGNKLFDFAAASSTEKASPFPPLPSDYKKPELVAHVEFKVAE
ncbi:MAG: energy transducer TonB [Elusimicrobiaceae bacterium]